MDRIKAAAVFIAINEHGSLAKAAEALGMSRSMVSRYLNEMESWADARLLHRSTRKLSLSSSGEKVLAECYKLQAIDQEVSFAARDSDKLIKGQLRIASSQFFGERILAPFISDYLQRYPQVSIEVVVSNQSVNLAEEGIDLAIRITDQLDPNLIAKNLGQLRSAVVASPDYIKARGRPHSPQQLQQHNCLHYSYFGNSSWQLAVGEKVESITVSGNLSANDPAILLNASLLDCGISLQPLYAVKAHLQSGALIQLLTEYQPHSLGIYGLYRSRKYMPKAMRLFLDELAAYLASLSL